MKTTIDIPEPLYKQAKIRAVETGQTLKQLVLASLRRSLAESQTGPEQPASYWSKRKTLPEFSRLQAAGAFKPGPGDRSIDDLLADLKADPAP